MTRMNNPMRLRFAPSPTGHLHVGNLRVALANYLYARHHGGEFLLRIDDTDTERNRDAFTTAIIADLHWLGLEWAETHHQSARRARYDAAADRLRASGRLYPCFETEDELRAKREARRRRRLPPLYDRAMLSLTPAQRAAAEANGKRPYWRFRLSDTVVSWDDMVLGGRQVKLPTISDPVLIRADGTPLYTLTSVVDDLELGITHILRGEDHVTNTGVQIDLVAALGGDPKSLRFGHLPLLTDAEGGKLSKRIDSLTLRSLARDGIEPEALAAYLARLGTGDEAVPLPLGELAAIFDPGRMSHAPARFDGRALLAVNAKLLHHMPFDAARARLPDGADAAFWEAVRGNLDLLPEARHWWEILTGEITPPEQPEAAGLLAEAAAALPPAPWDENTWREWTSALKTRTGLSGRALFLPLRLALTGEQHGPEMAKLLPLIGPERARARLAG